MYITLTHYTLPTVHAFGSLLLTHTLWVQTHNMTTVKKIAEQCRQL